jgi:hypothetical protein
MLAPNFIHCNPRKSTHQFNSNYSLSAPAGTEHETEKNHTSLTAANQLVIPSTSPVNLEHFHLHPIEVKTLLALQSRRQMYILCDLSLPHCPIVDVSPSLCDALNCQPAEFIGHSCCVFHGPQTTESSIAKLRTSLARLSTTTLQMVLFANSTGRSFACNYYVSPVLDVNSCVALHARVIISLSEATTVEKMMCHSNLESSAIHRTIHAKAASC